MLTICNELFQLPFSPSATKICFCNRLPDLHFHARIMVTQKSQESIQNRKSLSDSQEHSLLVGKCVAF